MKIMISPLLHLMIFDSAIDRLWLSHILVPAELSLSSLGLTQDIFSVVNLSSRLAFQDQRSLLPGSEANRGQGQVYH